MDDNNNFVFHNGHRSFDEVFPNIEKISVNIEENNIGSSDLLNKTLLTKQNFSEFHSCSNPQCKNGRYNIGNLVRNMVENHHTQLVAQKKCTGTEKLGRRCWCRAEVSINIEYTD